MKKVRISFASFPVITFKGSTGKERKLTAQKKFFNKVRKIPTPEKMSLPKQSKPKELIAA